MHPLRKVQIVYLKADESPTKVLSEYADFTDVFSPKLATELTEYTGNNGHTIEFVDD